MVLAGKRDIALRSAFGDPTKVILSGKGWDSDARGDAILHIAHCEGVTIADLTFADCRSYGIKVEAENAPRDIHLLSTATVHRRAGPNTHLLQRYSPRSTSPGH